MALGNLCLRQWNFYSVGEKRKDERGLGVMGGWGWGVAERGLKMHVFLSDNSEAVRKWANSDG